MLNSKLNDINVFKVEVDKFSNESEFEYKEQFEELRNKGILKKENKFYDTKWICRYGGIEKTILLPTEIELKIMSKKLGKKKEMLNLAWRSFLIKNANYVIITVLNNSLKNINKLDRINKLDKHYRFIILEFIQYIDVAEKIFREIEERVNKFEDKCRGSKELPKFESIFDFIDIINDIVENDKIQLYFKYIPIILWWKITSIIPLRPTEFLKTKFNCIYIENTEYYICINRTLSKKGKLMKNRSLEEEYYREEKICINADIYFFIKKIQKLIIKNKSKTNEYLVSDAFKNNSLNSVLKRKLNKNVFTERDLYPLLNDFYESVIKNEYNKEPINKHQVTTRKNTIERLTPYDSRHIAIINLILMGTEPQTVMELAGHDVIDTTQGYYNHIENYVKCFSISYAKKIKEKSKGHTMEIARKYNESGKKALEAAMGIVSRVKVNGGYCTYKDVMNDKRICFLNEGNHMICEYFIPNYYSVKEEIKKISIDNLSEIQVLKDLVQERKKIHNFSERYMILTDKIKKNMIDLSKLRSKECE